MLFNIFPLLYHGGMGSFPKDKMLAMPQVRQLPLVREGSKTNGNLLRRFLVEVASCRSHLELPTDRPLSWQGIGIDLSEAHRLEFTTMHQLLLHMHYVLALPETHFKKTSNKYLLRREILESKIASKADVLSWASRLVQ